jgi:hypothetical protein
VNAASIIRSRTSHPHTFCPRMIGPDTLVHKDFLSPYISSLKELWCSKRLFHDCYISVCFIPKGKEYVFNFLFPDFYFILRESSETVSNTQRLVGLVGRLA